MSVVGVVYNAAGGRARERSAATGLGTLAVGLTLHGGPVSFHPVRAIRLVINLVDYNVMWSLSLSAVLHTYLLEWHTTGPSWIKTVRTNRNTS